MIRPTERGDRDQAWAAVKLAVRSYSRDPSDSNARTVSRAWMKIRSLIGGAVERRIAMELAALDGRYKTH